MGSSVTCILGMCLLSQQNPTKHVESVALLHGWELLKAFLALFFNSNKRQSWVNKNRRCENPGEKAICIWRTQGGKVIPARCNLRADLPKGHSKHSIPWLVAVGKYVSKNVDMTPEGTIEWWPWWWWVDGWTWWSESSFPTFTILWFFEM